MRTHVAFCVGLSLSFVFFAAGASARAETAGTPSALCSFLGPCGDVNESDTVTSVDALLLLRASVGQPVTLQCAADGFPAYAVPPKTGQTACYNASGDEAGCAASGQDGETTTGADPLFSDQGDGTILDNATDLVWEVLDQSETSSIHRYDVFLNWAGAFAKVAELNATSFAGHNDWRLPNIRELQTLVDFGFAPPSVRAPFSSNCVNACSALDCSCTVETSYWSSTTFLESPERAWAVSFYDGSTRPPLKNAVSLVRAVRGGSVSKLVPAVGRGAAGVEPACSLVDPCGDVNESGSVSASDALVVLQAAVGLPVVLQCRVASAGTSAEILKTRQVTCYDAAGAALSCEGTDQDGALQYGVGTSYTDNGDGTISDQGTGLVWETLDAQAGGAHDWEATYTWSQAFDRIDSLNAMAFAGHDDWRLPNQRELHTLIEYGQNKPAVNAAFNTSCVADCTVATCSCTLPYPYWTSTSSIQDLTSAMMVQFYDGYSAGLPKTGIAAVRAVRGGE